MMVVVWGLVGFCGDEGDLRPEKSAASSDFERGRDEIEGKLGFRGRGAVVVVGTPGAGLDVFRGMGVWGGRLCGGFGGSVNDGGSVGFGRVLRW